MKIRIFELSGDKKLRFWTKFTEKRNLIRGN